MDKAEISRAAAKVIRSVVLLGFLLAASALAQAPETPGDTSTPKVSGTLTSNASPTPALTPTATPSVRERSRTAGEIFEQLGGSGETDEAGKAESPEQTQSDARVGTIQAGRSTFMDKLVNVAWSLSLVCLLIWGLAKVASKFGVKQFAFVEGSKSMIEVLEKKRISPGRSIMLMRVGPKVLAVAVTESGFATLAEFGSDDFQKHLDLVSEQGEATVDPVQTPADIARHYLSIIPGTGAKK